MSEANYETIAQSLYWRLAHTRALLRQLLTAPIDVQLRVKASVELDRELPPPPWQAKNWMDEAYAQASEIKRVS